MKVSSAYTGFLFSRVTQTEKSDHLTDSGKIRQCLYDYAFLTAEMMYNETYADK